MTYRFIEGPELELLRDTIEKQGWSQLNPYSSKALVCEEDGEILGFLVVQAQLHSEPIWVKTDKRGRATGIASELSSKMAEHLKENNVPCFFCQADNPFVVELCEENGMLKVESPIYKFTL
jgi:hypothetical protein